MEHSPIRHIVWLISTMSVAAAHRLALFSFFFLTLCAPALEIRDYIPTRHDRFIAGSGGLEINPNAYYAAADYTALGFGTNPNDHRQFALVTPEHVLIAKHFSFGGNVRFINHDGIELNRSIAAKTDIPNGFGGSSDLLLVKLSAPLSPADGIVPFPYLNLAENACIGKILTVFGQELRAGRGVVREFSDFSQNTPLIGNTRTFKFQYNKILNPKSDDDAYAVTGDSGSPSFVQANGKPALIGVHLAVSEGPFSNTTTDTFVPHYAETVNDLLAAEGYQLIPAYPTAVSLSATASAALLRQAFPGTIDFNLENNSAASASNVRFELQFPPNAIPDSLSAPGWIITNPSAGTYHLRRAELDGNSTTTATASYSAIPVLTGIPAQLTHKSDGSPDSTEILQLPVQETFAGFVSELAQQAADDDPDQDGFANLLEYAFGGDPAQNSQNSLGSYPLAPVLTYENDTIGLSFPQRTDAAVRGLLYEIEFSETLKANSWTTTSPPGITISAAPHVPDSPGFENVTATFPAGNPDKIFIRVKVTLSE